MAHDLRGGVLALANLEVLHQPSLAFARACWLWAFVALGGSVDDEAKAVVCIRVQKEEILRPLAVL